MKKLLVSIAAASLFVSACSSFTSRRDAFRDKIQEFQEPKIDDQALADLTNDVRKIAEEAKGRVGVDAIVLETGETISLNETDRYPMQSVYKLPIAMAVLKQVDDGKLKLDQKIRVDKTEYISKEQRSPLRDDNPNGAEVTIDKLIRLSIGESDGTASDVQMRIAGGAPVIQDYLTSILVGEMIVADTEMVLGKDPQAQYRNWSTPEGATTLLRAFHEKRGLSEQSYAYLNKVLIESGPGAKRLKGLLPPGTPVAHKTGTSNTNAEGVTAATNDIGIITLPNGKHLAIAVFVSDSPASQDVREAVIAKIAKACWDKWSK